MRIKIGCMAVLLACYACGNSEKKEKQQNQEAIATRSFEFDGNYILKTPVKMGEHSLASFAILTKDSLNQSFIRYVYIRIDHPDSSNYYWVEKTSFSGTKDNFSILAVDPIFGEFSITGTFFGDKGPLYDEPEPETVVFKGEVSSKTIREKIECTYYAGD